LINTDRYLSDRDISYIPEYEKKQIAEGIYYFYYGLPMEISRPFPYGFEYRDAIKIITDLLDDKGETEKALLQMKENILEIPLDNKHYEERTQAIENLEKYIKGEFALFGKFSVQTKENPSPSPLWLEYQGIKEEYPDSIAVLQVGDFFEFWGEDAKVAAEVLDINITERIIEGSENRLPMCGIPSHTLEDSINTLTNHGYTVALHGKDDKTGEMQTLLIVSGEEKQYDLGFGYLGNGLTVWNRLEEVNGDYKTVAHIDNDGNITYYDKEMPENIKPQIQAQAETLKQEEVLTPADEKEVDSDDVDTISDEETPDYSDIIGKEVVIDNHRFLIESVSAFSGDVSMRDLTFEEQSGFPISRSEKIEVVRQYLEPEKEEKLTPTFIKPKTDKVPNTMVYPEIEMSQRHNFVITDDELGYGGAKEKYKNNIEAIRVLKDCEGDNRLATPQEQEILSRYVGWGGLPDVFDESKSNWSTEYLQLKTILAPDEYEQARASTLNAHYTSPTVIKAMYKALENMNFKQGNILEPSCGTGNFMGLVPDSMAESKIYGIELDSITGRIAQQLYQKNSVAIQGFEDTMLPDSFFDVAVGNVPFGNYKVLDKKYDKLNFLIHDYFFAKTLDKVRP
ncbi:MAG: hypothetical protein GX800_04205, partial [Clostridiaceae bacterium]|nr:hypothetical protein [Clostridiaceae bacterium]